MGLQYVTDEKGQTKGVFIPIQEWDSLKSEYEGIEENATLPEWQKEAVRERVRNTKQEEYLSWEEIYQQLKV